MCIRPIRNQIDYDLAVEMFDKLSHAVEGSCDYERLEILSELIENYEKKTWPVELPNPIAALKYYMQYKDLSLKDLGEVLGSEKLASNLLNKQVPLSLPMLYKLYKFWQLPPHAFLKPYSLKKEK